MGDIIEDYLEQRCEGIQSEATRGRLKESKLVERWVVGDDANAKVKKKKKEQVKFRRPLSSTEFSECIIGWVISS